MRLIFVCGGMSSGGAERVVSILANYFARNYSVEILCIARDVSTEVFYKLEPSINVIFLNTIHRGFFTRLYWIRQYIKSNDIVIPFMEGVYCKVLASLLWKKCVIIPSERNDPNKMKFIWTLLRRLFMFKIDKFVVQTQHIKEFYPKFFQKKIYIIPNPVEIKQYTTEKWNENSKIILAIGRVVPQKNYPMMIKAFYELHKVHSQYILEIYGCQDEHSEYYKMLQNLIKELKLEDYVFINGRSNNVAELFAKAYMFVTSSNYEGLSNSLIEALCSGIPVISTKVSGATDLIKDKENGLLIAVGNQNELTSAMSTLIENHDLAHCIANNATKCRELLDKEKICAKWENVLLN